MLVWREIAWDVFVAVLGAAYTGKSAVLSMDSDGSLIFGIV